LGDGSEGRSKAGKETIEGAVDFTSTEFCRELNLRGRERDEVEVPRYPKYQGKGFIGMLPTVK